MSTSNGKYTVTDDMIYAINSIQPFQIALAVISIFFSGSVVFILLRYYNELVIGKPFVHIILMIAIADTMSSTALSFGFPKDDIICSIQGFTYVFFGRLSWLLLDVLVMQLYYFAKHQKLLFTIRQVHMIIWPFSILLQILPFITSNGYGSPTDDLQDDSVQVGICFYSRHKGSLNNYFLWSTMAFTVELFLSFIFILVTTIVISFLFLRSSSSNDSSLVMTLLPVVSTVQRTVIYYPISQLITTIPGIVYALYHVWYFQSHNQNYPKHYVSRQDLLVAITPLNNIFFTVIFYFKTDEAMQKWRYLLFGGIKNDADEDRLLSIDSSIEINR